MSKYYKHNSSLTDVFKKYADKLKLREEFFNSNFEDITRAFLDALDVDYCYMSKSLVLVKNENDVRSRLKYLGFVNPLIYNDKKITNRLELTKDLTYLYAHSVKYKINLTIIDESLWDKILLTNKIIAVSRIRFTNPDSALKTYNDIFKTLTNGDKV